MSGLVFEGHLPPPAFASIQTTYFCNLKCEMCVYYTTGSTLAGPHMEMEVFEKVAAAIFPFVERWQPSVAGEPIMSRGFSRMMEIAQGYGLKAEITTNATLLSERVVDSLLPGIGLVAFSFDGHDAETFESIRQGARFARVVENIKRLVRRARRELPEDQQPEFGLCCTIMEKNVRGLSELVALAADDMEVDFVIVNHLYAVVEEVKPQSLAHFPDLAKREFDRALRTAEEKGIALHILPLDEVVAKLAGCDAAELDRVKEELPKLGYREANPTRRRPFPVMSSSTPSYESIARRRSEAYESSGFPPRRQPNPDAPKRETIWFCDYLWNKTYVRLDGSVYPCCVPGAPILGNVEKSSFNDVWNNETYREMRTALVTKDPVPLCKGCMYIQEASDPVQIDLLLQGLEVPEAEAQDRDPSALDTDDEAVSLGGPDAGYFPGNFGRIHPEDSMLTERTPRGLQHYERVGAEVRDFLEEASSTTGRQLSELNRLLELGCGYGRATRMIARHITAERIDVHDINGNAAGFCAKEFGVKALRGTGGVPVLGSELYDAMWLDSVFSHRSEAAIADVLTALDAHLPPSGLLLFPTFGSRSLELLELGVYGEHYRKGASTIRTRFEKEGACFMPGPFAGTNGFGMTWLDAAAVDRLVRRHLGSSMRLLRHAPAGWDSHLDVFIYRRDGDDAAPTPTPTHRV